MENDARTRFDPRNAGGTGGGATYSPCRSTANSEAIICSKFAIASL